MASTNDRKPLDADLVDAVVQLTFGVQRTLGGVADRYDLSLSQLRMLGILRDREVGVVELARRMGLEKSSASGLVDRAERRGLLKRRADKADGRAVVVTLTAKGRRTVALGAEEISVELGGLLARLSGPQREQLLSLLGRLELVE